MIRKEYNAIIENLLSLFAGMVGYMVTDEKTVLKLNGFNVPVAYIVLRYRKGQMGLIALDLNTSMENVLIYLNNMEKEFYSNVKQSGKFCSMLQELKWFEYRIRTDCKTSVNEIINTCIEENVTCTFNQAWGFLMQGFGTSCQTGKRLKVITCKEKIRKTAKAFIDKCIAGFPNE